MIILERSGAILMSRKTERRAVVPWGSAGWGLVHVTGE